MPSIRDTATRAFSDLCAGFGLLTRLPSPQAKSPRPDAAWAWPLVGLVVGALAAGAGWLAMALGLPVRLAAVATIAAAILTTGALHEDGLADSADGLFGGWTPEQRLAIMKDSHIGTYGTLALLLVLLARLEVLAALLEQGAFGVIVAAAVISRAPMACIMALMSSARSKGLSQSVGRPSGLMAGAAALLATAMALILTEGAVIMVAAAALAALGVALLARARIGGQTGDILGAAQQMAELAALVAACALLAR